MNKEELLLNLIKENKTLDEIVETLKLPIKEIYKILNKIKSKGYLLSKKYYYDGEIKYGIKKIVEDDSENIILTSKSDNELVFMVISDLHLGSLYEMPKLLNIIYDYCTKENIHIILNAGDFIDGEVNLANTKIPPIKQIDHALRIHPISSDIINFLLLGNHDYSMLSNYGINIMNIIKERREDIVPIGFKEGLIKIKNDNIVMQHPLLGIKKNKGNYSKTLIIRGHGHESKTNLDSSNLIIYTPSLSKLNFNNSKHPGAIILKLKTRQGIIEYVHIDNLSFINNKMEVINESNIYFGYNKSFKEKEPILNEEEYPKVLRKVK